MSRRASKLLGGDARLRARVCWRGRASELLASEPWWYGVWRSGSELKVVAQAPRRCHASHSERCRASCSESGRASHSESDRASCSEVPLFCKHFRALRLRALWAAGPRIDSTPPNSDFTERWNTSQREWQVRTLKIRFFILPARRPRLLLASLAAASTPASLATGKISV